MSNNNKDENLNGGVNVVTDVLFGLFKKKEKSKKKSAIFSSKKKDATKPKTTVTITTTRPTSTEASANRRIIKATKPSKNSQDDTIQETNQEATTTMKNEIKKYDGSKSDLNDSGVRVGKVKDVENEIQRENSEKWRKERMDASAAIRKEMKEKEVTEHRTQPPKTKVETSATDDSIVGEPSKAPTTKEEMPAILSVASQFPEHKRTVNEALLSEEESSKTKKSRVEDEEEEEEEIELSLSKKGTNQISSSSWYFYLIPVAAAAITIFGFKLLRRR